MKNITEISTTQFISIKDVMRITGSAKSTIYSWVKQSYFPKPVAIGPNSSRFRLQEVRCWCEDPVKWRKENAPDT